MRRWIVPLVFLLMMVSPVLADYYEFIDPSFTGTLDLNNSVEMISWTQARYDPTGQCPIATGNPYENCTLDLNFTETWYNSSGGKNGVVAFESYFTAPVNISLQFQMSLYSNSTYIYPYDQEGKAVAFHMGFMMDNNAGFEGGNVLIYHDRDASGTLLATLPIANSTGWQNIVWWDYDEDWQDGDTFSAYLQFDNWMHMQNNTDFYFDAVRFFTVEDEIDSPSPPSQTAMRNLCGATGEWENLAPNGCWDCQSFSDTVGNSTLSGYIHKTQGLYIPCISLYYNGKAISRLPIDYLGDTYAPTWSEAHYSSAFGSWNRGHFGIHTRNFEYIYNHYHHSAGTDQKISTLLFEFNPQTVTCTVFNHNGGWYGQYECSTSGTIPTSAVAGQCDLWQEDVDISSYACTGSQFRFYQYGAGNNAYFTSGWFDIPYETDPICEEGFYCVGNQEYYQTEDCTIYNNQSCGTCGCLLEGIGGRCKESEAYWECQSDYIINHYNENCTQDLQLLCDIQCIEEEYGDDYCLGETVCTDDSDCGAICFEGTRYYDGYCDGSYTCKYDSSQECEYDCIGGWCTAEPSTPAFEDTSPTGIVATLKDGLIGFVSGMATPFFIFVFLLLVVIVIVSIFSGLIKVATGR